MNAALRLVEGGSNMQETDEQIEQRIDERFDVLEMLSEACTSGAARSVIASGPPGLGKTYTVENVLGRWDPEGDRHTIVKGYVRATGLVKLLYDYRDPDSVLVFDDSDSVFQDDLSLNLLKTACDTTETRRISWLSEGILESDRFPGEQVERYFNFEGAVIFITNLDFDDLIIRGHKLAPHLSALISRSHYVDLTLKTRRDYLVRIRKVIFEGLLNNIGLEYEEQVEVLDYIEENCDRLRELSLRMAIKLGNLRKYRAENWQKLANITCCR
jgi:hypothetical protein